MGEFRPFAVEIRRQRWYRGYRWAVVAVDAGSTMDSPMVTCRIASCRFRRDAEAIRDYWRARSVMGGGGAPLRADDEARKR